MKTSSLIPVQTQAVDAEAPIFRHGDKSITLFRHGDAWVCRARDLGRMLGYAADGARLNEKITRLWAAEFVEGVEMHRRTPQYPESGHSGGRAEILLTREGINGVCLLSRKPLGRTIREWLRRDVMPQIAATGCYIPPPQARVLELRAFINAQQELWDREHAPRLENPLKRITPPGAHPDIESALMWVRCVLDMPVGTIIYRNDIASAIRLSPVARRQPDRAQLHRIMDIMVDEGRLAVDREWVNARGHACRAYKTL